MTPSWDSGKISSAISTIGYVGNNLALDGTTYSVSLTTWDNHDVVGNEISGSFTMKGTPQIPSSFAEISLTQTGVTYSWNDNSENQFQETKFVIRNASGAVIQDNLAPDSEGAQEFTLTANTFYQRKVCAVNEAGESCSNTVAFYTKANDSTIISATPSHTVQDGHTIGLSWNKNGSTTTVVTLSGSEVYS